MPYIFKNIRFSTSLLIIFVTFLSCKGKQVQEESAHKFTNALIDETSPYLLQHAHNPVNWRAWSQDALDDAKKENKLVLVSIGYSSCHWCHVMEEETFEDEGVAKIMNDNFINIKVDREERPDVDHIYQTAIELIRGAGGWPLNAIILPNGKPIYLGTYHTQKQWNEVLSQFSEQYGQDAKKMEAYADMLAKGIQDQNMIKPSVDFEELSKDLLNESVDTWKNNWDVEWGGDKGAEKYMTPVNLEFLLDYAILSEDESVKVHVRNTLDKMIMGGVYDHVGGGFYRYSTDPQWKIPHFEKMLYDNAQLLGLYAKAYSIYKDENYKKVVLGITTFLEREMKNEEGGYFAAMDADSDGEEGAYYVWTNDELKSILNEDITLFSKYYNINPQAVWENGNYVLHKLVDDSTFVSQHDMTLNDLNHAKSKWGAKLLKARKKRIRPNIDDKIITSWNALLASGFIEAYKSLGQKEYLDKAVTIFSFIKSKSFSKNQLVHTYKTGSKQTKGFLEDYAFLISTSLDLYGVTMEEDYFTFAQELNQTVEKEFYDDASQMYKYNKGNELIAKIIKTHDGVIPSPNAISAHNLFRIGHLLYNRDFLKKSKQMLSAMIPMIKDYASGYAKWNALLLQNTYPYYEIAVVGIDAASLLKSLNEKYIPNTLVVGVDQESEQPLFKDRFMEDGTYIYVCQNSTCKLPVTSVEDAIKQLENF